MNFEHTEDRRMLADSLNRFVTEQYSSEFRSHHAYGEQGYASERWQQFAELGAIGALFPEDVGGFGGAGFDIAVVFECLGRGLVTEPFLGALLVGRAITVAGTAQQKTRIAELIDGSTVAALAHDEPEGHYELERVTTRAERQGASESGAWVISGRKAVVVHGQHANLLLVSARTSGAVDSPEGISLFLVPGDAEGLQRRASSRIDGGSVAELVLDRVRVSADALLGGEGQGLSVLEHAVACGLRPAGAVR